MEGYINNVVVPAVKRDPNKLGEALDRINEAIPGMGDMARKIIKGDVSMPQGGYAANSKYWQFLNPLVAALDPTYTPARFQVNYRARIAFGDGKSYPSLTRLATSRALQHVGALLDWYDSFPETLRGQIPAANAVKQWAQQNLGVGNMVAFNEVADHVSAELAKAFKGNQPAQAEINREIDLLKASRSPDQIRGAVQAIAGLLYGQMEALAGLWNESTNEGRSPESLLTPAAQAQWQRIQRLQGPGRALLRRQTIEYPNVTWDDPTPEAGENPTPRPEDIRRDEDWIRRGRGYQ
jgi:hypothetical protein